MRQGAVVPVHKALTGDTTLTALPEEATVATAARTPRKQEMARGGGVRWPAGGHQIRLGWIQEKIN